MTPTPGSAETLPDRQQSIALSAGLVLVLAVVLSPLLAAPVLAQDVGPGSDPVPAGPNGSGELPANASNATNGSGFGPPGGPHTTPRHEACENKGWVEGAICNAIEDIKHSIIGGSVEAVEDIIDAVFHVIFHRPAPRRGGEMTIFQQPTNEPFASAYTGMMLVGLPLGFMLWMLGVGIALLARLKPGGSMAGHGFAIEKRVAWNFLLVVGSAWVGAAVLHLANALSLAFVPSGEQLIQGPEAGVGSLLGAGLLAGLLWFISASIFTLLLIANLMAYVLVLVLFVFLPVFSALYLFDTGGIMSHIAGFGQSGWSMFIKAAFFPVWAAMVLGTIPYVGAGAMGFVESAIGAGAFGSATSTIAYAATVFILAALAMAVQLYMLIGRRGAMMMTGIMAGAGGVAAASKAKNLLSRGSSSGAAAASAGAGAASGAAANAAGSATDILSGSPYSRGGTGGGAGGALGAGSGGSEPAGALGSGAESSDGGGAAPMGVPTGGSPASPPTPGDGADGGADGAGAGAGSGSGAAAAESSGPTVVEGPQDMPDGQGYQPGYINNGEFQPVESVGQSREFVVRHHDTWVENYGGDGDHEGILIRGEDDGRLYDTSGVGGERWGVSSSEEAGISRDAVYDARQDSEGGPGR